MLYIQQLGFLKFQGTSNLHVQQVHIVGDILRIDSNK